MEYYSLMVHTLSIRILIIIVISLTATHASSAVILQYHHISNDTPRSTSVTINEFNYHLNWLEDNGFTVLPLLQVINTLRDGRQLPSSRVAVITFDDAYRSICDTAWPILKARHLPFTLFVSTSTLSYESPTQCSWPTLQKIHKSGLMTIGNHSHYHAHLLELAKNSDAQIWKKEVISRITMSQQIIDSKLGPQEKIFAYPYGEFNNELKSIVRNLGYISFGQHSGAVGVDSDFYALPRFPLSGKFADITLLPEKLLSLPFPATLNLSKDNPIQFKSKENPPTLSLEIIKPITHKVRCFLGNGIEINAEKEGDSVHVFSRDALPVGRSRYNCTFESNEKGRFYWVSHQWIIE